MPQHPQSITKPNNLFIKTPFVVFALIAEGFCVCEAATGFAQKFPAGPPGRIDLFRTASGSTRLGLDRKKPQSLLDKPDRLRFRSPILIPGDGFKPVFQRWGKL
jgi:hypothetical protein